MRFEGQRWLLMFHLRDCKKRNGALCIGGASAVSGRSRAGIGLSKQLMLRRWVCLCRACSCALHSHSRKCKFTY